MCVIIRTVPIYTKLGELKKFEPLAFNDVVGRAAIIELQEIVGR